MSPPAPYRRDPNDLIAFVAVLILGVTLLAMGVPAASLVVVTVGLAQLYAIWQGARPSPQPIPSRDPDTSLSTAPEAEPPAELPTDFA
ncbi:hypothetical protein [Streptomyces sp. NBC_00690]|uniref:hypothetical protein n=1 Tax=Streptomyces sp. NBC_00690 TaxID=2975808 RepID=UPI002E27FE2A|nr:hypothetical protein [Streptomyces sp. NBC_00690]